MKIMHAIDINPIKEAESKFHTILNGLRWVWKDLFLLIFIEYLSQLYTSWISRTHTKIIQYTTKCSTLCYRINIWNFMKEMHMQDILAWDHDKSLLLKHWSCECRHLLCVKKHWGHQLLVVMGQAFHILWFDSVTWIRAQKDIYQMHWKLKGKHFCTHCVQLCYMTAMHLTSGISKKEEQP